MPDEDIRAVVHLEHQQQFLDVLEGALEDRSHSLQDELTELHDLVLELAKAVARIQGQVRRLEKSAAHSYREE